MTDAENYRVIEGDVLASLAGIPDGSVQCVVTSPPYWGLRDYGVAGQIGTEATFAEYVDRSGGPESCWPWRGTTVVSPSTGNRYGRFRLDPTRKVLAHRFAFSLLRGDPSGLDLHHVDRCRNSLCCNPSHLEPIDHVDHARIHGPEGGRRAGEASAP